jgi:hypothetical protein
MRTDRTLAKFERTYVRWQRAAEAFDDDTFALPPSAGGWCPGQVLDHVIGAGAIVLDQVQQCIDGAAEDVGFKLKPALLCAYGSIPPMRIKVPRVPLLAPITQPEALSKSAAREGLAALAARTRSLVRPAGEASTRMKRPHPIIGPLNASQWFLFNEMHLRHHLGQLARLARARSLA